MKNNIFVGLVLIVGSQLMMSCEGPSSLMVIDESNKPVSSAAVVVQSMSMQGVTRMTGENGKVLVDKKKLIGAKWVMVSKDGYENQVIDLNEPWPEKVMLRQKNNGAQLSVAPDANNRRR